MAFAPYYMAATDQSPEQHRTPCHAGAIHTWSESQWRKQGFCLCYKVLERGHFPWPKAMEGKAALTPAQLAMLWEDEEDQQTVRGTVFPTNDWRHPKWTSAPTRM